MDPACRKQAKTLHTMFSSLLAGVEPNSSPAQTDAALQASACLTSVHSACRPGCSALPFLLAAGKARGSACAWERVCQGGSIHPLASSQQPAPLPARELRRADKMGLLSSRSPSSQMLSICMDIYTFCQGDNIVTTCSVFELLEYFLHNLMLRWDNAFGWAARRSGLLALHAWRECCSAALPGVPRLLRKLLAA